MSVQPNPYQDRAPSAGRRIPLAAVIAGAAVVLAVIVWLVLRPGPPAEPPAQESVAAPPAPTAAVTPPPALPEPSFDVVRISRTGTGVIAGRAAPNAKVEVLEGERVVGTVTADRRGEWVLLLESPLNPGTAELSVRAILPDGRIVASTNVVVINVPETPGDGFVASDRSGVVAVLSPKQGEGASRVLQRPGVPGAQARALGVDTVDYGPARPPVVAGRAAPRTSVRVYLDNRFVGAAEADADGRWQVAGQQPLRPGEHVLRVDQVLGETGVDYRIEQPFTAGQALDPALAQEGVRIREGNTLWEISRQLFGTGRQYTLIFRENSEQIADPDLIYPNQVFRLPDSADDS